MNTRTETTAGLDLGIFELIGYALTSARGLLDEPAEYGPLRLVEIASRLCRLLIREGSPNSEPFQRLKMDIDQGKSLVISDMDAFTRMIDHAVSEYTRLLKLA